MTTPAERRSFSAIQDVKFELEPKPKISRINHRTISISDTLSKAETASQIVHIWKESENEFSAGDSLQALRKFTTFRDSDLSREAVITIKQVQLRVSKQLENLEPKIVIDLVEVSLDLIERPTRFIESIVRWLCANEAEKLASWDTPSIARLALLVGSFDGESRELFSCVQHILLANSHFRLRSCGIDLLAELAEAFSKQIQAYPNFFQAFSDYFFDRANWLCTSHCSHQLATIATAFTRLGMYPCNLFAQIATKLVEQNGRRLFDFPQEHIGDVLLGIGMQPDARKFDLFEFERYVMRNTSYLPIHHDVKILYGFAKCHQGSISLYETCFLRMRHEQWHALGILSASQLIELTWHLSCRKEIPRDYFEAVANLLQNDVDKRLNQASAYDLILLLESFDRINWACDYLLTKIARILELKDLSICSGSLLATCCRLLSKQKMLQVTHLQAIDHELTREGGKKLQSCSGLDLYELAFIYAAHSIPTKGLFGEIENALLHNRSHKLCTLSVEQMASLACAMAKVRLGTFRLFEAFIENISVQELTPSQAVTFGMAFVTRGFVDSPVLVCLIKHLNELCAYHKQHSNAPFMPLDKAFQLTFLHLSLRYESKKFHNLIGSELLSECQRFVDYRSQMPSTLTERHIQLLDILRRLGVPVHAHYTVNGLSVPFYFPGSQVAVDLREPHDYLFNSRQLNGIYEMKQRLFRAMRVPYEAIPYWEWDAKKEYCLYEKQIV